MAKVRLLYRLPDMPRFHDEEETKPVVLGDIVDIDAALAESWISGGAAEAVKTSKKVAEAS